MACFDSDMSFLHDDESEMSDASFMIDDEENLAPPVAKGKKGSTPAATARSVLSPIKNLDNTNKRKSKTIEETYQKKTQLEHILLRPDTYIGSVERLKQNMFVLDKASNRIVNREITYTPGLFKIFDEIVVNAADNKQRDPNMDKLDITIDAETNVISVKNNGNGIPVVMHKEHECYVPTLIFGHLLTGSNFDDDEKKTTGGRNGYGAKLANIFSSEFIIECLDSKNGLKFTQTFRKNMGENDPPKVKKCTAAEKKRGDYTKISFSPDLAKFKMVKLDDDTVGLLSKRAYDIAGSMANRPGKKLAVTLNGKKLAVKSFQDYLKLFDGINPPCAYEKVGERWEVGVSSTDGTSQQISFVNAISTTKGGGHVNYIADQVASRLVQTIKKKNKGGTTVSSGNIKNHLCIFVNCLVENPSFDSQTKEFLTTRPKQFGSTCKLSEKFLKAVDKSDIVETILSFARFKQGRELKKIKGVKKMKLTGIPKLDDANFAGGAKSKDCTLIVTEGDSAKSLAMSGLSVVGRDYYGVFPLRGKPLNVRDASHTQVLKNEEIKNIIEILGLKIGVTYDESNIKTLRYGHLMIMADQDHDGSHIKGLVVNMIHKFWPSLLDVPGFLQQFITPIVKVSKGKKTRTFFTLPQYKEWRESTGNDGKGWKIKYYKGLGTSTSAEAKEYFSNLDLHEIQFVPLSSDLGSQENPILVPDHNVDQPIPDQPVSSATGADLIDMVFNKKRVNDRKEWLNNLRKETFLDYSASQEIGMKYSEFINKELILFSKSDCERSIPHVMDGFKPSQRKVLFACFKRKLKDEIKVAQLAGYVGEHSAYHHGEASLHGTIINMAQSFVGSNNINLLTPSGQFGTRRMGGKDAASPRYIFTKLEKITRAIFHPDDDELLTYLHDDGMSIEPEHYMPVIPMVLVNGSDGIGTGWSSSIPNCNPRTIIANLRRLIEGEELEALKPFYSGFSGKIEMNGATKFAVHGCIERLDDITLHITELPIKKWTQDYKEFLEKMTLSETKNVNPDLKTFQENHTDTTVSFTLKADKEKIDEWEKLPKGGLYAKFKLIGSLSNANMHLFDTEGTINKYASPEDILKEFFDLRMKFYCDRKDLLLQKLRREQSMLSNKARFVEEVCSGELVVSNRKKVELLEDLKNRGYELFDKKGTPNDSEDEDDEEESSNTDLSKGYEYLLGMKIWSLTYEKAEELRQQLEERTTELRTLENTKPSEIWLNDLEAIEIALDERDDEIREAEATESKAQKKNQKRQQKKKAAAKRGKKKKDEWDSEMEDSDEDEVSYSSDEEVLKVTAPSRRKAPTAKPAPKRAAVKSVPQKTTNPRAAQKKTATKKTAVPKPVPKPVEEPEEFDEIELSLTERLKKNLMVSPVASKPPKAMVDRLEIPAQPTFSDSEGSNGSRKRPSPRNDDFDSEIKEVPKHKAKRAKAATARATDEKKKPAPRQKSARKKKILFDSDSEDDFLDSSSSDEEQNEPEVVAKKPPARRAGARARATTKKATYVFDDDGSDSDFSFDE